MDIEISTLIFEYFPCFSLDKKENNLGEEVNPDISMAPTQSMQLPLETSTPLINKKSTTQQRTKRSSRKLVPEEIMDEDNISGKDRLIENKEEESGSEDAGNIEAAVAKEVSKEDAVPAKVSKKCRVSISKIIVEESKESLSKKEASIEKNCLPFEHL